MKRANFAPESGPSRQKWGPKCQYAQLKDKIGGHGGQIAPIFWCSATPHQKSWIPPEIKPLWIDGEKGLTELSGMLSPFTLNKMSE